MKHLDEYRDGAVAGRLAQAIARITTRPHTLMEVCGGQTHSIVKFGLDELLPSEVTLIHGPGCPVCVTPIELIDNAIELARRPNVVAKLSGLTTEADHDRWRPVDIAPYLTHAIEEFGPGRCMFGSDWPVATLATTYKRWVDLVVDVVAGLAADERAAILADTATRVYGLGLHDQEENP